ncbi:hypothetical protein ACFL23_01350 [Patescibacteria group bacterium]
MKINFTKKQFENLLKLVYLGAWMANAHRTDDRIKKYDNLEHYIFSFAKEFGFEEYVDNEAVGDGEFYPTRVFEEDTDVHQLHDEYDDETFWDEIIDRMAHRDFIRKYGIDKIQKMGREERWEKLGEFEDKYADEIDKNGIDRLEILEG